MISVIIPFHKNLQQLRQCLEPLRAVDGEMELIVVADGAPEDCAPLAALHGARVLEISGPAGPACARNRGAAIASGEILVFIDADVVVSEDAVLRLARIFETHSDVAAVFGAYDESPAEQNFISQYKNLMHSYIHQSARRVAQSFWAGLGAIRATVFRSLGGFDERYLRPCIEDIELGYRLTAANHLIVLDPTVCGRHLKRWNLISLLKTDIFDRAIPWTQLIWRTRRMPSDLNLRNGYRWSVVLSYLALLFLVLSVLSPVALTLTALSGIGLGLLNRRFYAFFVTRRGVWFALRVVPLHCLYHLYNGFSFVAGSVIFCWSSLGLKVPGAIPLDPWGEAALVMTDSEAPLQKAGRRSLRTPPSSRQREVDRGHAPIPSS